MAALDLGSLELEDTRLGASVRLRSSGNFAPSEKDAIDRLQELLTGDALIQDRGRLPWIRAGEFIPLILTLSFDDSQSESTIRGIIDNVYAYLSDEKAWKRLELEILSIEESSSPLGDTTIMLRLKYSTPDQQPPKNRHHKLQHSGSISDICPPADVGYVTAESFHWHVSLSGLPRPSPARKFRATDLSPTTGLFGDNDGFGTDNSEEDMLDDQVFSTDCESSILPIDSEVNESEHILQMHNEDGEILEDVAWRRQPPFSPLLIEQLPIYPEGDHRPSIECTTRLITTAMEAAILGTSRRRRKDIKVKTNEHRSLATVVPSVWLPGYLRSIAEKSIFLPTIVHALTNVLGSSASLMTRKKSMDVIRTSSCDPGQSMNSPPNTSALSDSVHARLWKHMEGAVYQVRTAKSPRLIWVLSDTNPRLQQKPDDILEPGQEEDLGAELLDEFQDPLPGHYYFWSDDRSESSMNEFMEYDDDLYSTNESDSTQETVTTKLSHVFDNDERIELMDSAGAIADSSMATIFDEDLLSVCSSIGMLSLPDADRLRGDDVPEMLSI